MRIASALSTLSSTPAIGQDIEAQLALSHPPDLLLVFITQPLLSEFQPIVNLLQHALKPAHMLAVIAESVVGPGQEIERAPAVSALAFAGAGAALHSFRLDEDQWQDVLSDPEELSEALTLAAPFGQEVEQPRMFLIFGDPFTTPIVQLLDACTRRFPGTPIIGGMASGMQEQGETRLALNGEIYNTGLVGVAFTGNIDVHSVVSQGCRGVGDTFVVTKSHHNVIEQLNGQPALAAIEEMVQTLPLQDRLLLQTGGLHIGRVIDQGKGSYGKGDFLIRSLLEVKRDTGAVAIGDLVRTGQTLQFHVRDAKTADEEMRLLLEGETLLSGDSGPPAGALLITCNGRGTRMFDQPNHDVALTRQILGDIPIAGFFAAGELGPVGDKNFIHGHTAALALFRNST
ncbi:MAG TPA: FIST N-terminal domain-containing protein [Phycisphaerae bacterium]|jgi:small ligand-binding sensory domain FIST|nr:FIST N-terminal domain-containing protein [Phycisphaerae bacterium]